MTATSIVASAHITTVPVAGCWARAERVSAWLAMRPDRLKLRRADCFLPAPSSILPLNFMLIIVTKCNTHVQFFQKELGSKLLKTKQLIGHKKYF